MNRFLRACVALLVLQAANLCRADLFGSGANSFEIEFVPIGQPGNPADTTGNPNPAGAVPYGYRIGKYEIPEDAVRKANALSVEAGSPLGLTLDARGPNKPATSLSWFEAAQFVNWLNTSTGATPAYKFDTAGQFQLWTAGDGGFNPANPFRNTQARYFLPSADEWYKAAFYDPVAGHYWDYPTGSDIAPIPVAFGTMPGTAVWNQLDDPAEVSLAGGPSTYGTVGQGGNVWEWEETERDLVNDSPGAQRGLRGGAWNPSVTPLNMASVFRNRTLPDSMPIDVGFRIARVVPEPGSVCLAVLAFVPIVSRFRRSGNCADTT